MPNVKIQREDSTKKSNGKVQRKRDSQHHDYNYDEDYGDDGNHDDEGGDDDDGDYHDYHDHDNYNPYLVCM